MDNLTERIDNFIEKSSNINKGNIPTCSCGSKNITHSGAKQGTQCHECGRGFKDAPVKKGVTSVLNRMKGNPPSQKVIIPQKLNYNPVTLERISKQLTEMVYKISA
jgi:hypothetical protein